MVQGFGLETGSIGFGSAAAVALPLPLFKAQAPSSIKQNRDLVRAAEMAETRHPNVSRGCKTAGRLETNTECKILKGLGQGIFCFLCSSKAAVPSTLAPAARIGAERAAGMPCEMQTNLGSPLTSASGRGHRVVPVRHGCWLLDASDSYSPRLPTLNPQPSTLNPQPSTLNPTP